MAMWSFLKYIRPWLEPAAAAVFVVLWMVAEAGRNQGFGGPLLLVALGVAIGICRVAPYWAMGLVVTILLLQSLRLAPLPSAQDWPAYLGILIIAGVIAATSGGRARWVALAAGLPIAVCVASLMALPLPGEDPRWTSWVGHGTTDAVLLSSFVTISSVGFGLYVGAWAVGLAISLNVAQMQARFLLRHTAAELAVAETELMEIKSRDWIAREVHDLLGHSLAVITAQADGARLSRHSDTAIKDAALSAISGVARSALIDVRAIVEGLREEHSDAPQSSLADVDTLLARLASTGMSITMEHFGEPQSLTPARELAVFRILQESLTNSLRHAGAAIPVRVSFDWRGPGLALTVTSAGPITTPDPTTISDPTTSDPTTTSDQADASGQTATPDPTDATGPTEASGPAPLSQSTGHGIRGMKDRARLAGGWLSAGQVDDAHGSFLVAAFIPVDEARGTAS